MILGQFEPPPNITTLQHRATAARNGRSVRRNNFALRQLQRLVCEIACVHCSDYCMDQLFTSDEGKGCMRMKNTFGFRPVTSDKRFPRNKGGIGPHVT
jgi:hypothetical protein